MGDIKIGEGPLIGEGPFDQSSQQCEMLVQVVMACVRLPDDRLGIGHAGGLPWPRLAVDLERFRVLTSGSADAIAVVVMGRRTWDSLPANARPLRNRLNIVLASDGCSVEQACLENRTMGGVMRVSVPDLSTIISMLESWSPQPSKVSVIGGAALFEHALASPWCALAHVTHIDMGLPTASHDTAVACDTSLPAGTFRDSSRWAAWSSSLPRTCEAVGRYTFVTYVASERGEDAAATTAGAPHAELQFTDLIRTVLREGHERTDRTGTGTRSLFGAQPLRFDMRYGSMPVLTTKRVFWRGVVEELLWFMRGSTDARELAARDVHIWDANGSRAALDAAGLPDRPEGDLGPCFVSGTLVCLGDGYSAIQEVQCGDVVHTHRGNLCAVTRVMHRLYTGDMVDVHVTGLHEPIRCTPEHPFYVRQRHTSPRFVPAGDLAQPGSGNAYFVGMKIGAEDAPAVRAALYADHPRLYDPEFWWVMGMFVGCGGVFVPDVAACDVRVRLSVGGKLPHGERLRRIMQTATVTSGSDGCWTYTCGESDVVSVLTMFGSKRAVEAGDALCIPALVYAAPRDSIKSFLEGVADGQRPGRPVGRALTLQLQRLVARLDVGTATEGAVDAFVEDGYMWHAVQRTVILQVFGVSVHNLSVDADESYVVHNAAVHNCYGFQFRHYGARYVDAHTDYAGQGIDQIAEVVRLLRTDPMSRRIILSAWNPAAQTQMALPPCHVLCQFYVVSGAPSTLSCHMYQRSVDIGLGLPFNIASYALLTCILAHVTGMRPGELIITMGDAHIYSNHVDAMRRQLALDPRAFPRLTIGFEPHEVDFPADAHLLRADQFKLVGYNPRPSIPMPMAV